MALVAMRAARGAGCNPRAVAVAVGEVEQWFGAEEATTMRPGQALLLVLSSIG